MGEREHVLRIHNQFGHEFTSSRVSKDYFLATELTEQSVALVEKRIHFPTVDADVSTIVPPEES